MQLQPSCEATRSARSCPLLSDPREMVMIGIDAGCTLAKKGRLVNLPLFKRLVLAGGNAIAVANSVHLGVTVALDSSIIFVQDIPHFLTVTPMRRYLYSLQ